MIAIKPVSDLRNYNEVLQDVADESPVLQRMAGWILLMLEKWQGFNV